MTDTNRYNRQERIKGWNQEALAQAYILIAGAGALGNELIKNLALMGVGHLLVVDFDVIEHSNLSRTVLFRDKDIGRPKAQVAAEAAASLNPDVDIRYINGELFWLIEITDVIQAEGAWGSPALLLFTGETWSKIHRSIDKDSSDKKLVGWFHTHLFKATDEFGLSGLDQNMHRQFLTKPWQIAVLLNIDTTSGEREVRCFQRGSEGKLVEYAFEVFDPKSEEETS